MFYNEIFIRYLKIYTQKCAFFLSLQQNNAKIEHFTSFNLHYNVLINLETLY